MELEAFELVLLWRPPDSPAFDDETLNRIQRGHVEYYQSLREQGLVVTNGPAVDQPNETFRGIVIFCTGSVEEARRLAEQDPAVLARRLGVEVMAWWCPPSTMTRPGKPVSTDDD